MPVVTKQTARKKAVREMKHLRTSSARNKGRNRNLCCCLCCCRNSG